MHNSCLTYNPNCSLIAAWKQIESFDFLAFYLLCIYLILINDNANPMASFALAFE